MTKQSILEDCVTIKNSSIAAFKPQTTASLETVGSDSTMEIIYSVICRVPNDFFSFLKIKNRLILPQKKRAPFRALRYFKLLYMQIMQTSNGWPS